MNLLSILDGDCGDRILCFLRFEDVTELRLCSLDFYQLFQRPPCGDRTSRFAQWKTDQQCIWIEKEFAKYSNCREGQSGNFCIPFTLNFAAQQLPIVLQNFNLSLHLHKFALSSCTRGVQRHLSFDAAVIPYNSSSASAVPLALWDLTNRPAEFRPSIEYGVYDEFNIRDGTAFNVKQLSQRYFPSGLVPKISLEDHFGVNSDVAQFFHPSPDVAQVFLHLANCLLCRNGCKEDQLHNAKEQLLATGCQCTLQQLGALLAEKDTIKDSIASLGLPSLKRSIEPCASKSCIMRLVERVRQWTSISDVVFNLRDAHLGEGRALVTCVFIHVMLEDDLKAFENLLLLNSVERLRETFQSLISGNGFHLSALPPGVTTATWDLPVSIWEDFIYASSSEPVTPAVAHDDPGQSYLIECTRAFWRADGRDQLLVDLVGPSLIISILFTDEAADVSLPLSFFW